MNKTSEIKIICKSIWYYSQTDEEFFFEWIQKIRAIDHFEEIGDELYLYFKNTYLFDNDLRELLALFYRYKIDMKQLQIFLNDENRNWFYGNPKGYWQKCWLWIRG